MKTNTGKAIAFTWWWSGWHVLPIASLLEYAQQDTQIQQKSKTLYWFGEKNSLEQKKAALFPDVEFVSIQAWKLRRYITIWSILLSIRDMFRFIWWLFQSLYYLKKYKIDKVFCKGWYVAVPVCYAARMLNIPIIVHESDTHMWLANRMAAKVATKVFTGFEGVFYSSFTVWQLLSLSLSTPQTIELSWFDMSKTTLLFMGWSQGADTLFALIPELIKLYGEDIQYIVLTGLKNKQRQEKLKHYKNVWALWFINQQEMAYIMSLSDLSVTRWSATSLEEQELFGIKKIIVPLPFTWGNHQEINADWYVKQYDDHKVLQNEMLFEHTRALMEGYKEYKKKTVQVDMKKLKEPHRIVWEELIQ